MRWWWVVGDTSVLLWINSLDSLLKEVIDLWLEAALQERHRTLRSSCHSRCLLLSSPPTSLSPQEHERHPRAVSLLAAPPTFYLRYGMARAGVKLLYSVIIGLLVFEAIALRGNGDGTEGDAAYLRLALFVPAWVLGVLQLAVGRLYRLLRDRFWFVAFLGTPYRLRANERFFGVRHARAPWGSLFLGAVVLTTGLIAYCIVDKPAMGGWRPFLAGYDAGVVSEGDVSEGGVSEGMLAFWAPRHQH